MCGIVASITVLAGKAPCSLSERSSWLIKSMRYPINRQPATCHHHQLPALADFPQDVCKRRTVSGACKCSREHTWLSRQGPQGFGVQYSPLHAPSHSCPVRRCAPCLSATVHCQCGHTHTLTRLPVPYITDGKQLHLATPNEPRPSAALPQSPARAGIWCVPCPVPLALPKILSITHFADARWQRSIMEAAGLQRRAA